MDLRATAAVVGVEPFFVPLKVVATIFGATRHTWIFTGGFV